MEILELLGQNLTSGFPLGANCLFVEPVNCARQFNFTCRQICCRQCLHFVSSQQLKTDLVVGSVENIFSEKKLVLKYSTDIAPFINFDTRFKIFTAVGMQFR